MTSRNKLHPCGIDVLGDTPAMWVVADAGQEIDVAAQPAQPDGDVERATADKLSGDLSVALDDVDQRYADHQAAAHRSKASSVARAPLLCNESSAQR